MKFFAIVITMNRSVKKAYVSEDEAINHLKEGSKLIRPSTDQVARLNPNNDKEIIWLDLKEDKEL